MSDVLDEVLGDTPKEASKGAPEGEGPAPQPQTPLAGTQGTPGPDTAPATDATPTGVNQPPPGYVPLSALLDDREKRQKAQAEAERLRAELARLQQQPSPPTYAEDPEGWARAREAEIAQHQRNATFRISETFAIQQYGAELVQKAKAWSEQQLASDAARYGFSPLATVVTHDEHPIDRVVKEYQQAQRLAEIGTDWDAWARKRAAELAAQPEPNAHAPNGHAPPQPATPPSKPFAPPKSLVDAPSAGGMRGGTPGGPLPAFEALFPK